MAYICLERDVSLTVYRDKICKRSPVLIEGYFCVVAGTEAVHMPDLPAFQLEISVSLNLPPKVTAAFTSGNLSALSYAQLYRSVVYTVGTWAELLWSLQIYKAIRYIS